MINFKVALLAGTLGQGGAEKQLVYIARALNQAGAQIQIYCLTKGEYYEAVLKDEGISPVWIGKHQNPLLRSITFTSALHAFRPHILQSAHFYTNLYAAVAAPFYRSIGIGSIRGDTNEAVKYNGIWGKYLLCTPEFIVSNSLTAKQTAISLGVREDRVFVLPNVIDLIIFDQEYRKSLPLPFPVLKIDRQVNVIMVGSLIPVKRFDRFLLALQKARESFPALSGFIVGDGPERARLESLASELGLIPDGVHFLGRNDHVPAILRQADIFVLTSDHEGFPNVILEAMAAQLPVITMPAGDSGIVVEDGITGYVVPFEDVDRLSSLMVHLAKSPELHQQLGLAGRKKVEQQYSYSLLGDRLLQIYKAIAIQNGNSRILNAL